MHGPYFGGEWGEQDVTFKVRATEPVHFECAFGPVEETAIGDDYKYEWGPCYGEVKDGENAMEVKYEGLTSTEWFKFGVRVMDKAGNMETSELKFVANAVPPRVVDIRTSNGPEEGQFTLEFDLVEGTLNEVEAYCGVTLLEERVNGVSWHVGGLRLWEYLEGSSV